MSAMNMTKSISISRLLLAPALALTLAASAHAAVPGITGPTFNLTAQPAYLTQPDGQAIYSWGYGCDPLHAPAGYLPATITTGMLAVSGWLFRAVMTPSPR